MGGGAIQQISFSQFLEERRLLQRRAPLDGALEITARCNLSCGHCYINRPAGDAAEEARELSLAELERTIDEIAEAGCLHLLITGGEPLLRSDFPAVYLHALRRGLLVTVFTNGILLTDEVADLLASYRPFGVEITVYGATSATCELITRVPSSHESCLAGIERLVSRGIPLRLKTMALAGNHREVGAMRDLARRFGLPFRHDGLVNARLSRNGMGHRIHQLPPERVVELDLEDPDRVLAFRRLAAEEAESAGTEGTGDRPLYDCGAGRALFTIDPYGTLHACGLVRRNGVDIRGGGFAKAWKERLPGLLSCRRSRPSPCRACGIAALCGSCAGANELEHADPESPVAAFCRVAHLRAHAVGAGRPGHRADASCCIGAAC